MDVTILQEIATEVQSETKWKQLGELAMSTGKVVFPLDPPPQKKKTKMLYRFPSSQDRHQALLYFVCAIIWCPKV